MANVLTIPNAVQELNQCTALVGVLHLKCVCVCVCLFLLQCHVELSVW